MALSGIAAGVQAPNHDQLDARTSRLVKVAREKGIDPAPLVDIDHERRTRMAELLDEVSLTDGPFDTGTDAVLQAQHEWDNRWNSYTASMFGGLVAAAGASVLGTIAISGVDNLSRLGVAAYAAGVGAALIGVPVIGIATSRASKLGALAEAKASEQRENARDREFHTKAIEAAKEFAAEVKANPSTPIRSVS